MTITAVDPFILHLPLTQSSIADSTHNITHWGVVGARVTTDDGFVGYGFTGTHAHLASDRLVTDCIRYSYAPLLIGEDERDHTRLWMKLARSPALQWVGRAGIIHLALGAIDIALWDIAAKRAEVPLWRHLGGATSPTLEAYNTDVGWLSFTQDQILENCRKAVDEEGFTRLKIKVGHKDPMVDIQRLKAVRSALPSNIRIATDANGAWDLPTAQRFCTAARDLDLFWLEEPLWYDDIQSHALLAERSTTPIALGEQLYSVDAFRAFIERNAVAYVQPDVARLGGITEYIQVANLALANRLPVVPHAGEMSQVHVHLSFWHPSTSILEYIPWIKDHFEDGIVVKDGYFKRPEQPGAGTTLKAASIEHYSRPLS